MKPTLAELAAALLAVFEGPEKLVAYRDGGGVWTIGRGHTRGVQPGQSCSSEESAIWFAQDQAGLLDAATGVTYAGIASPVIQQACYVSFGYNCGKTALARVLSGADTIANLVHTTDHRGIVEPGLVSRRTLERLLIEAAA